MRAVELDDDHLIAVAAICPKLHSLEFDGLFTERGMTALSSLSELCSLNMVCVFGLTANSAKFIPCSITHLDLGEEVTDDIVIPFIYRLINLSELDVSQSEITIRTLEEAVIATKARTNGQQLTIHAPATLRNSEFNNTSSLLMVKC